MRAIAFHSLLACGLLLLAGCGGAPPAPAAGMKLPPPERVMVAPFTATAQAGGKPRGEAVLQQALVAQLRFVGLPAEAGSAEAAHGKALLVQGQIVRADEAADVQLLYVQGDAAPQFVEAFDVEARGGIDSLAQRMAAKVRDIAQAQGWMAGR